MSRSSPSEDAFEIWSDYFSNHLSSEISDLVEANSDSEDCIPLNLSLSEASKNDLNLFERIVSDPIAELENGEFILQKMVENEGAMFEVNLRFNDLPPENYKDPAKMSSKDIGELLWFDTLPDRIGPLRPWFKKAAWKCEKCSRITLVEVERNVYSGPVPPKNCDKSEGGCGRMTKYNFRSEGKKKQELTDFELVRHYGTLLDIRNLKLSDVSVASKEFDQSKEEKQTIPAVAVGQIARDIDSKIPIRVTGILDIAGGVEYQFEIIGCDEVPKEKLKSIMKGWMEEE